MYTHHHKEGNTEEPFASRRLKSQAVSTIRVPPKIASMEQLAITVKELSKLDFFFYHLATNNPLHSANIKMIKGFYGNLLLKYIVF